MNINLNSIDVDLCMFNAERFMNKIMNFMKKRIAPKNINNNLLN